MASPCRVPRTSQSWLYYRPDESRSWLARATSGLGMRTVRFCDRWLTGRRLPEPAYVCGIGKKLVEVAVDVGLAVDNFAADSDS